MEQMVKSIMDVGVIGVCLYVLYNAYTKKDTTQYEDNKADKERLYTLISETNATNKLLQDSNEVLVDSNKILVETNAKLVGDMSSKMDTVLAKLDKVVRDDRCTK